MPSDKQSIVQKSTSILLENKNRVRIKKEVKNWHFLSSFPRNAFSINQANIIILQSINISIVWLWITIYFSELHFSSIKSFIKVFILNMILVYFFTEIITIALLVSGKIFFHNVILRWSHDLLIVINPLVMAHFSLEN